MNNGQKKVRHTITDAVGVIVDDEPVTLDPVGEVILVNWGLEISYAEPCDLEVV